MESRAWKRRKLLKNLKGNEVTLDAKKTTLTLAADILNIESQEHEDAKGALMTQLYDNLLDHMISKINGDLLEGKEETY
eukprot:snap_masked-scaffold_63-processed-gene-0.56-mRNA-1 protein AED:1.00 eAED:1.00 QI:0/-1/0/0/-1/1/1/0/78